MIPMGETKDGRPDLTNFELGLLDVRMTGYPGESKKDREEGYRGGGEEKRCCRRLSICPFRPSCLPILLIILFLVVTVFVPLLNDDTFESPSRVERSGICSDPCRLSIVESIPVNLTWPNSSIITSSSTFNTWRALFQSANHSIYISALYWTLNDPDHWPSSSMGSEIFTELVSAARRGVKIKIVQNVPTVDFPQIDSAQLQQRGLAEVRNVNMSALLNSTGVLHTKFLLIDQRNFYIGSANMDWRSLSEVKELGISVWECACLAMDLNKIFNVYWRLGEQGASIPRRWPVQWKGAFNARRPLMATINGSMSQLFISSAPIQFNPKGRENDVDAIRMTIANASETISIAVMDYMPATMYMGTRNHYWPDIDDAIRSAAYRGVNIRLLISQWTHSDPAMLAFLRSLIEINPGLKPLDKRKGHGSIQIRLFTLPPDSSQIPFTRVNHNKYMITDDDRVYIGTSNWAGDYFLTTAGIGFNLAVVEETKTQLIDKFKQIFDRDWNSIYARQLDHSSSIDR